MISLNDKSEVYVMNSKGEVERFFPFSNLYGVDTVTYKEKNALHVGFNYFVPYNFILKDIGIIYGTNKLMGADTSIDGYATTPIFPIEYVDETLRFTDNSRSSVKQKCKIYRSDSSESWEDWSINSWFISYSYAVGENPDAYVAFRGYVVYEDIKTHDVTLVYSEPIYTTYNLIKALEE